MGKLAIAIGVAAGLLAIWLILRANVPQLARYQHSRDALASILPLEVFGIYPCASIVREKDVAVFNAKPLDQCYKLDDPRHFRGIWLDEFETSEFFEGVTDPEIVRSRIGRGLKTQESSGERLVFPDGDAPSPQKARLVELEFVGRRTSYPAESKRKGILSKEIFVDRVISSHPVHESKYAYIECEFERTSPSCE